MSRQLEIIKFHKTMQQKDFIYVTFQRIGRLQRGE